MPKSDYQIKNFTMVVLLYLAFHNCYPLLIAILGGSVYEKHGALYSFPDGACFDC